MSEEKLSKALVKDIVSGFMRFQADAMRRMTQQGIRVETTVDVLARSAYACLFETARLKMKILGKESPDVGHEKAFLDEKTHQKVANEILEIMLNALRNTTSRYVWRLWLMKREKSLEE